LLVVTAVQRTASGGLCVLKIKTAHCAEFGDGVCDIKTGALCNLLPGVVVRRSDG
jgi:hypothetical protein